MNKKNFRSLVSSCAVGMGLMLPIASASADDSDLGALTAQWWQWVHSVPHAQNPLNDATGANCMIGQHGRVWFLAGTSDGTPSNRTCHVPRKVKFLVPAINLNVYNSPNVCGQDGNAYTVRSMRDLLDPYMDEVTNVSMTIDGMDVRSVPRVKSDPFRIAFPENSFANAVWCSGLGGQPAGVFGPSVDDGYYALIGPLKAGTHTLHSHAESPAFGVQDNTYTLIVE